MEGGEGGVSAAGSAPDHPGGGGAPPPTTIMTVHVKFGGRAIPLQVSPDFTVRELKSLLQPLTNVLPRGQKLISKGKVLADLSTLKSSQISDGSKIMLVASHGLHQGDGPIIKDTPSNIRSTNASQPQCSKIDATIEKNRSERWRVTGVVALSDCQLKVIPEEVWISGANVRVLDVSNNFIREISAKIGTLTSISKLFLNANDLLDDSINWESLSCLKCLSVLSLSQNHLTSLPSVLCALTSLTQLHVANNKLMGLPSDIGFLNQLQILKAGNNRIVSIPPSVGNCFSLVEVDFSSNLLEDLPETLGDLRNLKALYLGNNGLRTLPTTLFKMCSQLSTLDLHGTEITNDVLRQFEGWEAFDERRRLKVQKQFDFRVGFSGGFDEGADANDGP